MKKHIFALDIGTRSVTGIILKKVKNQFELVDYCMKEHQARSMHDGQIHDVKEVSHVIKLVKQTLEDKHGPLHHVCVAAAGRSLKAIRASTEFALEHRPIISEETIKHLELSAVNQAQKKLLSKEDIITPANYYCVGYSVLYYKLDGETIGSLIEQKGEFATVEVIATFLPKVVVESLIAALKHAELKMQSLTLEPIAAIHLLVPESMRRLKHRFSRCWCWYK